MTLRPVRNWLNGEDCPFPIIAALIGGQAPEPEPVLVPARPAQQAPAKTEEVSTPLPPSGNALVDRGAERLAGKWASGTERLMRSAGVDIDANIRSALAKTGRKVSEKWVKSVTD